MAAVKLVSVFLLAVFTFGLASAGDVDLMKVFEKCGNDIGIDQETIKKFNATRPIETDNEKIKCYLKCVFQATDWMTLDGKIKEGPYNSGVDLGKYKPIVQECLPVKGDNACETAFLFHKCVMDKEE